MILKIILAVLYVLAVFITIIGTLSILILGITSVDTPSSRHELNGILNSKLLFSTYCVAACNTIAPLVYLLYISLSGTSNLYY